VIALSLIDSNLDFPQSAAQRTVNLYAESIGKKQVVLRTTPGLKQKWTLPGGAGGRGIFSMESISERLFAVKGNKFYQYDLSGDTFIERGTLSTLQGFVQFANNTTQVLIADGSFGYGYDVNTHEFRRLDTIAGSVVDPWPGVGGQTGAVYSGLRCVSIEAGTGNFWCSNQDDIFNWSGTAGAEAETFPDPLVGIASLGQILFLLGSNSYEVWLLQDFQDFPYRRVQAGSNIGCAAKSSIVVFGGSVFWLGGSAEGKGIVYKSSGYQAEPISDIRTDEIISGISDISDATAFIYQEQGHVFYRLSFGVGNLTLSYDITTELWAQCDYRNSFSGTVSRRPEISQCVYAGLNLVQDFRDGTIYEMSRKYFTDAGKPVVREKVFATWPAEQETRTDVPPFGIMLDMGNTPEGSESPKAMMSFSNDRGMTYGPESYRDLGQIGEYGKRVVWHGQGSTFGRNYKVRLTGNQDFVIRNAGFLEV
jgi:hypothetical protein